MLRLFKISAKTIKKQNKACMFQSGGAVVCATSKNNLGLFIKGCNRVKRNRRKIVKIKYYCDIPFYFKCDV